MSAIKRTIVEYYRATFAYDDYETVGYLVGGVLTETPLTKAEKKNHEGDWSVIKLSDVWSMIHNGDRQPVTFWNGFKEYVTYYPTQDDITFRVIRVKLTA